MRALTETLSAGPQLCVVTPEPVCRLLASGGWRSVLCKGEQRVFSKFEFESRRRDWLAGRVAAKLLIRRTLWDAGRCDLSLRDIWIRNEASGAPFVSIGREAADLSWNISIAHAEGYGVCALSHTRETGLVGVDFEPARKIDARLHDYFLTNEEKRHLYDPRTAMTPLVLWTVKEAVIKALRNQGPASMRAIRVRWGNDGTGDSRPRITARFWRWNSYVIACAWYQTMAA